MNLKAVALVIFFLIGSTFILFGQEKEAPKPNNYQVRLAELEAEKCKVSYEGTNARYQNCKASGAVPEALVLEKETEAKIKYIEWQIAIVKLEEAKSK